MRYYGKIRYYGNTGKEGPAEIRIPIFYAVNEND